MNKNIRLCILPVLLLASLFASCDTADAYERRGHYASLQYSNSDVLKDFNEELYLGRALRAMMKNKSIVTTEDEVMAKIDVIIEKAEIVLDMYPKSMHITVIVLPSARDVARIYKQKYGRDVDHIAYYSLSEDTIYISAENGNLEVISHEIGHAIVDHFFEVRPPYHIHELMAQFTSAHIQD